METDGGEEHFRTLYRSTRSLLLAYALRRTSSPEDAADVVAEVFTIAWRRIDDLPGGGADLLWLYATTRRVMANDYRRMRHRAHVVERIRVEAAAISTQPGAAHEDAMLAILVLGRLSADDREILMLAGWEGLRSSELAVVLGCSPTAARIRLHRARSRLKAEFALLGGGSKQDDHCGHLPPQATVTGRVVEEARE